MYDMHLHIIAHIHKCSVGKGLKCMHFNHTDHE